VGYERATNAGETWSKQQVSWLVNISWVYSLALPLCIPIYSSRKQTTHFTSQRQDISLRTSSSDRSVIDADDDDDGDGDDDGG